MSRIISFDEDKVVNSDDFLLIDGASEGTRKIKPENIGMKMSTTVTTIIDGLELRDDSGHSVIGEAAVDIGSFAVNSLRIRSTLNSRISLVFYGDIGRDSTTPIANLTGQYAIVIDAGNTNYINITEDALELLKCCRYLKFRYKADTVPTTGALWVYHVGKG